MKMCRDLCHFLGIADKGGAFVGQVVAERACRRAGTDLIVKPCQLGSRLCADLSF